MRGGRTARFVGSVATCALCLASAPATANGSSPVLEALVLTSNGDGVFSNSDNTSGTCGLFRAFVIAGADPTGTILNPIGNWSDDLTQTLGSGQSTYTMLATGDLASDWSMKVYFGGLSSPLVLSSASPTGTIDVGGIHVSVSASVSSSTLDRVSACFATPDGVKDTVSHVLFTLPTLGTACAAPAECPTGFCVDGVCCNTACDGTCAVCARASGAAVNGTCTTLPEGPNGVCERTCVSVHDCPPPEVCSPEGLCAAPPPAVSDASGCRVPPRAPGGAPPSSTVALALAAAAALARRRGSWSGRGGGRPPG
jgi:hypothetical protein